MFNQKSINVPVLGIVKTWHFTPFELPENKYYIFEKMVQNLISRHECCLLGEVPIVQSIESFRLWPPKPITRKF